MKFSDMMGKSGKAAVDEAEATETVPAPPSAPRAPEAPIRFGENRADTTEVPLADADVATAPPVVEAVVHEPSVAEVMAELAPRAAPTPPAAARADDSELDATAWLEGLSTIDDDLLPR